MLSWGWRGIEVWSTLSSLGITAMLRGFLKDIVNGWPWYDQLFLFGGAFLLILGILAFVITRKPSANGKTDRGSLIKQSLVTAEQLELLDFYKEQRQDWTSYIKLRISDIACHTKAASPYLVFNVKVSNFLPVKIKIIKLKGNCDVDGAGLPQVAQDIGNEIERCKEGQFDLRWDINGTQIPQILQGYESNYTYASWFLKGAWQIEAYGETKMLPHDLQYSRIPFNSM